MRTGLAAALQATASLAFFLVLLAPSALGAVMQIPPGTFFLKNAHSTRVVFHVACNEAEQGRREQLDPGGSALFNTCRDGNAAVRFYNGQAEVSRLVKGGDRYLFRVDTDANILELFRLMPRS